MRHEFGAHFGTTYTTDAGEGGGAPQICTPRNRNTTIAE